MAPPVTINKKVRRTRVRLITGHEALAINLNANMDAHVTPVPNGVLNTYL